MPTVVDWSGIAFATVGGLLAAPTAQPLIFILAIDAAAFHAAEHEFLQYRVSPMLRPVAPPMSPAFEEVRWMLSRVPSFIALTYTWWVVFAASVVLAHAVQVFMPFSPFYR